MISFYPDPACIQYLTESSNPTNVISTKSFVTEYRALHIYFVEGICSTHSLPPCRYHVEESQREYSRSLCVGDHHRSGTRSRTSLLFHCASIAVHHQQPSETAKPHVAHTEDVTLVALTLSSPECHPSVSFRKLHLHFTAFSLESLHVRSPVLRHVTAFPAPRLYCIS